ncbi:hypothetical protein ACIQCF_33145 [Streptomyces sp. NPDC088353]|uniref:hypothetical protein n=1 Tax=Streptomyces sp. NPDC088353 TaxID=3365855 RepID=UPI003830C702
MASVAPKVPKRLLDDATEQLAEFFRVQGAAIAAHLEEATEAHAAARRARKATLDEVFDQQRWDRVLALEILTIALSVSQAAGRSVLKGLGVPDEYDTERTRAWLAAHAAGVASGINGTTRYAVRDALAAGVEPAQMRQLFDSYAAERAPQIAQTEVTASKGFGTYEAGRQSGKRLTKTWITGKNPRSTHSRQNRQTVPLRGQFSNGARWPGDSILPTRERARCNCMMTVNHQA